MKRVGIALGVVVVAGVGLYVFRVPLLFLALSFLGPSEPFDAADQPAGPDYASAGAWLARPETQDLADYAPAGIERAVAQAGEAETPDVATQGTGAGDKPVDVFFVHPTTYLHGEHWIDPLASGTSTEENTRWVLANQASAYNGCCNVYAPRYRQTSIYAFLALQGAKGQEVLDFAYRDVERAFDHFVSQLSQGRPFILAAHSQGTIHLRKLLRQRIHGTPLASRMVAAYLIGGGVNLEELAEMPDLPSCRSATDVGCVVGWQTYGPDGRAFEIERGRTTLCTNPLSWQVNEEPAPASANLGAVVPSGSFNIAFRGEDRARGVQFEPLGAPLPGHTGAQCKRGMLMVDDQAGSRFAIYAGPDPDNYHGLDYALFYMNIRTNAQARVDAYLARGGGVASVGDADPALQLLLHEAAE